MIRVKNNTKFMQMNQRIEEENNDLRKKVNELEAEKTSNGQRIKLLEHEKNKLMKMEGNASEKEAFVFKLQAEVEELKLTNTVYFEQIGELIDKNNALEDELERYTSGRVSNIGGNRREPSVIGEGKSINQDNVKTSYIKGTSAQTDDPVLLKKEMESLKDKIVDLTDKNMELQNKLHEVIRGKSQSKKK